jgi:hypothetical protein
MAERYVEGGTKLADSQIWPTQNARVDHELAGTKTPANGDFYGV